jgi:DNA polymerase-1
MKLLTVDLEVENYSLNKRVASPFDLRNYIVQIGWSVNGGERFEKYYTEWHRTNVLPDVLDEMGEGDVLIGFNIKFDLLWVWDDPRLQAALKRGMTIYCGQYAEYLIEGMDPSAHMVSMNEIAEKYGGGCKLDAVKELWENGSLTSQIPRNMLTDYLIGDGKEIIGDIQNTWLIYCGQVKRMRAELSPEFRKMLKLRMDGLLATTEMEYNGMFVDREVGEELRQGVAERLAAAEEELDSFIPPLPDELEFNWGSNTHKSCLIFGGTVKYEKWLQHKDDNGNLLYAQKDEPWPIFNYKGQDVPVDPAKCKKAGLFYVVEVADDVPHAVLVKGKSYLVQERFKGGQRKGEGKYKNVKVPDLDKPKGAKKDHYFKFKGYVKPNKKWLTESTDAFGEPMYSTNADVIEELTTMGIPFTNTLGKRTSLSKDLGTYYWSADKKGKSKGMLTLVDEHGLLHHKLNHTSTVTSRLSSSDPNLQNLPRSGTSEVKKMFSSRFGKTEGRMAEIDYSQLEVVIQGVLTKDKQLVQDLNDRVDFHCKRLAVKLNEPYADVLLKAKKDTSHPEHEKYAQLRTFAKEFSFQRAYGAGVDAVVASTGMSKADVEALVEAESKLYPGVAEFDRRLEAVIIKNRKSTTNKLFIEGVSFTQGISHWDSPTGTRYTWREGITPDFMHRHGKYTGFSPTERKNYPVQGFGGEVVQAILGRLFRYMLANDRFGGNVLLVNSVHDCVWLDGKVDIIEKVAKEVKQIMETIPELYNSTFPNLDVNVPFPTELEIGTSLFDKAVVQ